MVFLYTIQKKISNQIPQCELDPELFIDTQLLSFNEAAEWLQVTKEKMKSLVSEERIVPFSQKRGSSLFLLQDVHDLKIQSSKDQDQDPLIDERMGITRHSVAFFHDHKDELDDINQVFIYFKNSDAAWDGFYRLHRDGTSSNALQRLEAPHMVIRDVNGKEIWLYGCNCGYGGEGPHGSESVLETLGFEEELRNQIFMNRVVKFFRCDNGSWEVIGRPTGPYPFPYMVNGSLAMLKSFKDPRELKNLRRFILNPIKITMFENSHEAEEYGYLYKSHDRKWYPIVVEDQSGRIILIRQSEAEYKTVEHLPYIFDLFGFQLEALEQTVWDRLLKSFRQLRAIWKKDQPYETSYQPPLKNPNYSIFE